MAHVGNKGGGRKGRRSDNKTETGKSSAGKADDALNFTLTAGALGLGIALLERDQAAAASVDSATNFSHDDERLSDFPLAAEQAEPGIDESTIPGHAVHGSGSGVPRAVSVVQINQQAASPADSEGVLENAQQSPEAAESQNLARDGHATGDMMMPAVPSPTSPATAASASNSGQDGAIEGAQAVSSLPGSGRPGGDIMPGDTPAERMIEAVSDITGDLLGSDGALGIVPSLTQAVGSLVGEDGVVGALTDSGGNVLDNLVGEIGEGAVLGGLINSVEGVLGDADGAAIGDLSGGGEAVLDGLVGKDGALDSVVDAGGGVLDSLIGDGGLLGSSSRPEKPTSEAETAASPSDTASTGDPVETVAQTEPEPTNVSVESPSVSAETPSVSAEMPSNIFEVTNAALQITEFVADALTPTLTFVGQPIIEVDGPADMDNANSTSAQHAA